MQFILPLRILKRFILDYSSLENDYRYANFSEYIKDNV